jgi:hypothetical protein
LRVENDLAGECKTEEKEGERKIRLKQEEIFLGATFFSFLVPHEHCQFFRRAAGVM